VLVIQAEFFQHFQAPSVTATPLPNGTVQTIAATMAAVNVKNPRFILDVRAGKRLHKCMS
jgi:hypothetical protein